MQARCLTDFGFQPTPLHNTDYTVVNECGSSEDGGHTDDYSRIKTGRLLKKVQFGGEREMKPDLLSTSPITNQTQGFINALYVARM